MMMMVMVVVIMMMTMHCNDGEGDDDCLKPQHHLKHNFKITIISKETWRE